MSVEDTIDGLAIIQQKRGRMVDQGDVEMLALAIKELRKGRPGTAARAEVATPRPVFVGVWGPEQIAAMRDCKPGDIQVVYPLDEEWNAALQAALDCYSPDDSATDWALKISYLKRLDMNSRP